jgi:hypothetical protein
MRRKVDLRWIRRTFARVEWLADRAPAEKLASALVEVGMGPDDWHRIWYLADYLDDVRQYMERLRPEAPQPCAVCGEDIRDKSDARRRDVRYCSPACRQRAYRGRVTARRPRGQETRHEPARCDASPCLSTPEPSHGMSAHE